MNKIELLKKYDVAYYNGEALVSDEEYDEFREKVFKEFPDDVYFAQVGAEVKDKTKKVNLPFMLGSLKKFKQDNIEKWINKYYQKDFYISDKLDGLSIYIEYENGTLKQCCTRGDGIEGFDITKKAKYFLPYIIPFNERICLRGEILLQGEEYKELGFSNRRNGASGIINRDGYEDCEKLKCVIYEYINSSNSNYAKDLKFIHSIGLNIVYTEFIDFNKVEKNISIFLKEYLLERKKKSEFDIDGIVIFPFNYERENVARPENKIAFKVNAVGEDAVIDHLEWNMSRTGRLIPLAIFETPIEIDGSNITKAAAHNFEYVNKNKLGSLSQIKIVKSGDVIPYITEVLTPAKTFFIPTSCPSCGTCLQINGVDLICKNKNCPEQNILFLEYFFKKLGAENVSAQTFRNLETFSLEEVFSLTEEYISNLDGFGERSAKIIIDEINNCKNTTVEKFVSAVGIKNFGEKNVQKFFNSLEEIYDGDVKLSHLFTIDKNKNKFISINGFGEKIYEEVVNSLDRLKEIFIICKKNGLHFQTNEVKSKTNGSNISFTGKGPYPRKQLEELLKERGYNVVTLGKETEILLCGDKTSNSSKMKKAQKLNINIKTYEEFFNE